MIRSLSRLIAGLYMLVFLPAGAALAQTQPAIDAFSVDQVSALTPGSELNFTLNGSTGGKASLKIDGVTNAVNLAEVQPGIYQGAYTVRTRDKLGYNPRVRATLTAGGRSTSAMLGQSLLTESAFRSAEVAAGITPRIERLSSEPDGALGGGQDISFAVKGTPGAKASVKLAGSDAVIALSESAPGEYAGTYTIRSRDRITASSKVTATLALAGKSGTASKVLSAPAYLVAPAAQARMLCDTCGVVQAINKVEVEGKPGYTGAIAGGVAGAVLGSQIGKGDGRTAAQIAGAVGGAYAGREIEKQLKKETQFDVVVKLDNGGNQTVRLAAEPAYKPGARVKIEGNTLVANP